MVSSGESGFLHQKTDFIIIIISPINQTKLNYRSLTFQLQLKMPRVLIESEAAAEPRAGPSDPMVLLKNPDIPFSFRSQVYSNVTEADEDSVDDPYTSSSQRDYTKRQIDPRLYNLPVEGLWDRIARMPPNAAKYQSC